MDIYATGGVTSTTAPIATGWSESYRAGFAPAERPCLCTAHEKVGLVFSNGDPEPDLTVLKREVREGTKRLQFTRIMLVPNEHRFDRPAWVFRVDDNPLRLDAGSIGLGENVINALEEYRVLYGAESGTFLGLDEFGVLPEF